VEALGRAGDVLLDITTSGNWPNMVAALERGRELGLRTVALTICELVEQELCSA
jgi:D-sedoheptulose 7-phosphate isomerase